MLTMILSFALTIVASEPTVGASQSITPETAARNYRIEVYTTFRQDRTEYDRRIIIGRQVWRTWSGSEKSAEDRQQYVSWFQEALNVSRPDFIAELPATDTLPQVLVSVENLNSTPESSDEADATRDDFDLEKAIDLQDSFDVNTEDVKNDRPPTPFDKSDSTTPVTHRPATEATSTTDKPKSTIQAIGSSLLRTFTGE